MVQLSLCLSAVKLDGTIDYRRGFSYGSARFLAEATANLRLRSSGKKQTPKPMPMASYSEGGVQAK